MKKSASRQPLFEVRHSPVHGYGVFALRKIRKGTTVTEYLGERVSHEEADSRYENKDANDNHTFLFTVDSKTVIDGGVGGNDARYINHGCDPNCESTTLKKRIYVEAVRTILPGEELAYDYQIERDPDDPPNVDEIFACRCGAAKCRGSMLVARKKPRKKSRKKTAARASKLAKRGKKSVSKAAKKAAKKAVKKSAGAARKSSRAAGKNVVALPAEAAAAAALKRSSTGDALVGDGIFTRESFLAPEAVRELIECATVRRARGEFAGARIGGDERVRRADVRGDHTCWLEEPLFAAERVLLAEMEQLRLDLNAEAFLGLFDLEMHYAWYPPGAGYARHVDQPQGRADRLVSVVLYLNESWVPEDGGQLRLFDGERARDVEPLAGRLVGFLTAGREHAVLPTRKDRLSLTGWFRRRPQSAMV